MTKNKIFFIILGVILLIGIFYFAIQLNSSTKNNKNISQNTAGALNIWILEDESEKMKQYVDENFKKTYPQYEWQNIIIESFSDTYSYYTTLASAFLSGTWPDIFMLQNSDSSVFQKQVEALSPELIAPNDFTVRFKPVFWEDLVVSSEEDETQEYVTGVPLWYEALGVYFNRRYFLSPTDFDTWEALLAEMKNISEKYEDIIPIALGNGSSVTRAGDIIVQLFTLEWASSVFDLAANQIEQALALYTGFWDPQWENKYNTLSLPYIGESDIDLFTQGDVAAMVGYPRDLLAIDKIGYQKSFLLAHSFPSYAGKDAKISIKYNYLALSKDSSKKEIAGDFLAYLASVDGQAKILEYFPYYLPAESSIEAEVAEKKILPQYNIVYNNFIIPTATLKTFGLSDANYFMEHIWEILDNSSQQSQKIEALKSYVICATAKHQTFLNLSSPCK